MKLSITNELHSAVKSNNYSVISQCVSEIENKLFSVWISDNHKEMEPLISACIQQTKRARQQLPDWRTNPAFRIGELAGIVNVYSILYQEEKDRIAIDKTTQDLLRNSGKTTRHIFSVLAQRKADDKWMHHQDLAKAVDTSVNSLSNIMKRLIPTEAIDMEKDGKYTNYRLSASGKRYYQQILKKTDTENNFAEQFSCMDKKLDEIIYTLNINSFTSSSSYYPPENISYIKSKNLLKEETYTTAIPFYAKENYKESSKKKTLVSNSTVTLPYQSYQNLTNSEFIGTPHLAHK